MGSGPVLNFWRDRAAKSFAPGRDWTQQELAQFYRVEWALRQAGISVDCDRGLSDEGDPWFAFCRSSDAEVVIHIAREGQTYILAGFLTDRVQRGRDFGDLVERLLAEHPARSIDKRGQSNVVMHPATMLALLVSIAFLHSTDGKAASTGEHHETAASALALGQPQFTPAQSQFGAASAPRLGQTLASTATPLAASFELTQAMTILRVASLMNQLPIDQALTSQTLSDSDTVYDNPRLLAQTPTLLSERTSVERQFADHAVAPAAQVASSHLNANQTGVEKLLEVVAKLWTFPDAAAAAPAGFGVAAALAFFAGSPSSGDAAIAPVHQTARSQADSPAPAELQAHAKATEQPADAPSTVTITHTPGSADTTAQTIMKLTVADQTDIVLKPAALGSAAKVYSIVSDIVEHAKSLSADSGATILGNGKGELELQPGTRAIEDALRKILPPVEHVAATDEVKTDKPADKVADAKVDLSYTTAVSTGMVTHNVLDDSKAEAVVERAIAAFKEDVRHYSVAVTGKDVIFYNADAVINHSTDVVVEFWQFKDGSSISLVGLSIDGHLPYSL